MHDPAPDDSNRLVLNGALLIAMAGAYAAFNLAGRVTAPAAWPRLYWVLGGATATGIGTWSMHYVGMLAFHLPVPVQYDWPTALASPNSCDLLIYCGAVSRQSAANGLGPSPRRRSPYGRWHRCPPLHCYGFDPAVRRMSLFPSTGRAIRFGGDSGLPTGVGVDIQF
jgi:hypothetical protein